MVLDAVTELEVLIDRLGPDAKVVRGERGVELVVPMYSPADLALRADPAWFFFRGVWWPVGDERGHGEARYRLVVDGEFEDDDETLEGPTRVVAAEATAPEAEAGALAWVTRMLTGWLR